MRAVRLSCLAAILIASVDDSSTEMCEWYEFGSRVSSTVRSIAWVMGEGVGW